MHRGEKSLFADILYAVKKLKLNYFELQKLFFSISLTLAIQIPKALKLCAFVYLITTLNTVKITGRIIVFKYILSTNYSVL